MPPVLGFVHSSYWTLLSNTEVCTCTNLNQSINQSYSWWRAIYQFEGNIPLARTPFWRKHISGSDTVYDYVGNECPEWKFIEIWFRLHLKADISPAGLLQCYERYNKPDDNGVLHGSQRCGMLIKAVMEGAKDTPTCYRRSSMIMNLSPRKLLCVNYIYFTTDENLSCFLAVLYIFVKNPVLVFLLHPYASISCNMYVYTLPGNKRSH